MSLFMREIALLHTTFQEIYFLENRSACGTKACCREWFLICVHLCLSVVNGLLYNAVFSKLAEPSWKPNNLIALPIA